MIFFIEWGVFVVVVTDMVFGPKILVVSFQQIIVVNKKFVPTLPRSLLIIRPSLIQVQTICNT
mgnify:CR=1 FL=1